MAISVYDDLQLRIDRDADGTYRVLAMAPDGRIARGSFVSPIDDDELDEFVQRVGLARRRGGSTDMRMEAIKRLGSSLFDSLIKDEVGTVYYSARGAAAERDRGLRITLRLSGSPELMRLPWEFLYKRPRFLAQSTQTPVVRALDVDSAMRPERLVLPLRILAMVSSPSGYPELDANSERRNLERALAGPRAAGLVEVSWLERATLGELTRRINEFQGVHVLHYIGHGAYDEATESGILVLETPQGRAQDVTGEEIGAILQDETSLRLVVLNACEGARTSHVDPFSGVAASLVNFDIPAVIGMQFEITDDAAIAFSESLYTGLAQGLPVDAALAPARRAIVGAMLATEFGTPVLFLRDGDARLFDVQDLARGTEANVETDAAAREDEVHETPAEAGARGFVEPAEPPAAEVAGPMSSTVPTGGEPVAPAPAASASALSSRAVLPSRAPSVTLAVGTAWAGALLLAGSAVLLLVATFAVSSELATAAVGAQVLAGAALAVHYGVRPTRDATVAAFLYGAAAVLGAVTLIAIGQDSLVSSWAHLGSALLLMVIGWWLIRDARHAQSPYAVSLQAPAAGVLVAGFVSAMVEVVSLIGASWQYNWLWPLSILGMAGGYAVSALTLTRETRDFATRDAGSRADASQIVRIQLPATFAWTGAIALVVLVVAALTADPYSTEAQLGGAVAQAVAIAALATCHATRPRHDSTFAVIGYALAAAVSFAATLILIFAQQVYDLYLVIPWTDLAIGVMLGAVGVWLAAVGRARGGRFGRSLWMPGPYVIAAGAMTALTGAVVLAGSDSVGAVIVWAWPLATLGMAVAYALSALSLVREGDAEPSAPLVARHG